MDHTFNFNQSCTEFFVEKGIPGYSNCIESFKSYLKRNKILEPTISVYFQGIRSDELVKALEFYIVQNQITSFGAANKYISAIREYFTFIIQKSYIENNELMKEFAFKSNNPKSYRYKAYSIFEKYDIKVGEGFDKLSEVEDLIGYCNNTMKNEYYLSRALDSKVYFNKYRSALMIKLILLTGSTYRNLISLTDDNIDLKHCSLTLNNLTIHIPDQLVDQMSIYKGFRKEILKRALLIPSTTSWFIEFDGKPISTQTSTVSDFLSELIGRGDLNGIIKCAIIEMIKCGINQSVIQKFTGVGDTIYNDCQKALNDTLDLHSSTYLDSKIRKSVMFNSL